MIEYIDKQNLLRDLERKIKKDNERRMAVVDSDFIDLVNDATVIEDVVEVVRCKDCKYFGRDIAHGKHDCLKYEMPYCLENDYCSYGERKDNGEM